MQLIPADVVRELRTSRGWRQLDLAKRLGWPLSRVTRLENRQGHLRLDDLPTLCREFGLPLAVLLRRADPDELKALGLEAEANARPVIDVHVFLERPTGDVLLVVGESGVSHVPNIALENGIDVSAAASRLAQEVFGVKVLQARCAAVVHHRGGDGKTRVGFFFAVSSWCAKASAGLHTGTALMVLDPDHLPAHISSYCAAGLRAYRSGEQFAVDGWTTP